MSKNKKYMSKNKKYLVLLIPLVALCMVGMLSGDVYPIGGHFKDQSGIGGTVYDCNKCHDFVNGIDGGGDPYGTPTPPPPPPPGYNLRWLKTTFEFCSTSTNIACDVDTDCPTGETCVSGPTVKFTKFSQSLPADGTLGDGNSSLVDGACEVCHTGTTYHNKFGTGASHYFGTNCTACHPHFTEDFVNYFAPAFVGGQSHFTHFDDPKGPMLGTDNCTYCHSTYDFHIFADGKPLVPEDGYPQGTAICDPCHSKGGTGGFDGVDDPVIGAKPNWEGAIYEPAILPAIWPSILKAGKDNWCAGCHDNGTSVVNGVSAPNVMGNNVSFGYNKTGHGRNPLTYIGCALCHDLTEIHTDTNARTYSALLSNYQSGYRLKVGMAIPRNMQYGPSAFLLCMECHRYTDVVGPASDFRQGKKNLHEIHIGESLRGTMAWDSDWDVPTDAVCYGDECADSAMSCTACHNVHGSPCLLGSSIVACDSLRTPMIRHGELISTPGTQDKVPALKFNWYDTNSNPTTDFDVSGGGGMLCSNQTPYNIPFNKVCWGCHTLAGEVKYYRIVTVKDVWTTDTSNNPLDTFHPGETIRYHVRFTVYGQNQPYYIQAQGIAQKADGTGPQQTFLKSQYLNWGNYEWTEDKLIPSTVTLPPGGVTVRITITVGARGYPLGEVLASDVDEALFFVVP